LSPCLFLRQKNWVTVPDPFAPPRTRSLLGNCLILLTLCLLLILGWCSFVTAEDNWLRYRLSVTLMTPRGPRTGSGVLEVHLTTNVMGDHHREYEGDAIAIDLPDGRILYALPSWPGEEDYAAGAPLRAIMLANPHPPPRNAEERLETQKEAFERLRRMRATADLPADWPLFIIFTDPNDPRSARRVMPGNIQVVLGAGYAIRRVSAAVTEDGVSRGIEQKLPWVTQRHETPSRFDGQVLRPPETLLEARHLTR
jgi:hypothetical protein